MATYYEIALDVIVVGGLAMFLWSVAHSLRLIAEAMVQSRRAQA